MQRLSQSEKVIAEKLYIVTLIRSVDESGRKCFFYIMVSGDKWEIFSNALKQENCDPAMHGIVLESGYGEPTDEIKYRMEKEYGIIH